MSLTIGDEVRRARDLGMSRRALAQRTGLSEGKIWRIENKGTASPDEVAALRPVLDSIAAAGALPTAPSTPEPATPAAQSTTESPAQHTPPATVGVDWTAQLAAVAEVTALLTGARGAGPDRTAGNRLVSNSEVQTFTDCPRRWWLGWYRRLQLKAQSPVGLAAVGGRLHRALRFWYVPDGQPRVDPRAALELLITQDWGLVVESYGGEQSVPADLWKQFTTEANLERVMLEGYVQHIAETGADADYEIIASETYLEADLTPFLAVTGDERPVHLIGLLDVRLRRRYDGTRLFMDHKSVGNFVEPTALLPLDEQMLTYHLLEWLNTDEAEERCDGALYNMLRRVKRTPQAKPPFYQRVEVRHNPTDLDTFRQRLIEKIRHMRDLEDALDQGADGTIIAYPRPSKDCRWKCPFFAVCPMFNDGSRAEAMIEQYFAQHDPLDRYAEEGTQLA